ncbi:MAG: GNAT family N-acetyltransferase, partial [Zoogloeaceae bacterium]|nr:GNAT family N-acetyltransferase [Zoogloeaceae bacterium]
MSIVCTLESPVSLAQFTDLLCASTLGERRPVDDPARLSAMLEQADLIASAWEGETLVGIARAVTDFAYCCYVSDLAVRQSHQRGGIGKRLLACLQGAIHPEAKLILLAAPAAQ